MRMPPDGIRLPKLNRLRTWQDEEFRSAAWNMAIDEACLEISLREGVSVVRFYHWDHAATTIGYFDPYPATGSAISAKNEVVRRFTGGGRVDHGEDATFALCLSPGLPASLAASGIRYRWIHEALAFSLSEAASGRVTLVPATTPFREGPCFSAPVAWDLIDRLDGQKIAGGAQRRTRGAVLHQGSIRLPELHRAPRSRWVQVFFEQLAETNAPLETEESEALLFQADRLVSERYGTFGWNQRV